MPKVLISDDLSPRAVDIFKNHRIDVDVKKGMKSDQLIACIGQYEGLAVRSATKVTEDVLAAATNLKVVGRAGIGVDNIDINGASARGVVVMNTPFGNAITTAEHAIAMMFALARQLPAADASTQSGKWEKSRFMGTELTGKTLGIIGCGNIGSRMAERALGLKMKVSAYDPFLSPDRAVDLGVEKAELDELFERADVITLHTPLTDATREILDARAFDLMKDGVLIINCARGELIVEADLRAALEAGRVGGVAVDVFAKEPPENYSLFGMDNVIATPHLGAATSEAQENVALQVAEQISDYLLTGAVTNAINMPSVSAEEAPRLRPYMALAEELGSFAFLDVARTGGLTVDPAQVLREVLDEYPRNVWMHLSNRAIEGCLQLISLLHPHGALEIIDVIVRRISDYHQVPQRLSRKGRPLYRMGFKGPAKYDGSAVDWFNGRLFEAAARHCFPEVEVHYQSLEDFGRPHMSRMELYRTSSMIR